MNKLIQDIGFVQHIQKPKNAIKIPIKYFERIDTFYGIKRGQDLQFDSTSGITIMYKVTIL